MKEIIVNNSEQILRLLSKSNEPTIKNPFADEPKPKPKDTDPHPAPVLRRRKVVFYHATSHSGYYDFEIPPKAD